MKKILISFVGTNDCGGLLGKGEGAILTALQNEKYDELLLLWNDAKAGESSYSNIVEYIYVNAKKKKLVKSITNYQFTLTDVTDHNEIYSKLKKYTDCLQKNNQIQYTAAISSGTPSMQVCWIMLAESGDFSEEFPLRLIKVKDPKFGKTENVEVKLDTSLPRIQRLKSELESVKSDLIPPAIINIERGSLFIGNTQINLSPIEFCNYRYFAELLISGIADEKFSGISVPIKFMQSIYSFHEESFPDLELNRDDLRKMLKNGNEMAIQSFRGNISKINKKIRESLENETLYDSFHISIDGKRGAKFYGIKGPVNKIKIISD